MLPAMATHANSLVPAVLTAANDASLPTMSSAFRPPSLNSLAQAGHPEAHAPHTASAPVSSGVSPATSLGGTPLASSGTPSLFMGAPPSSQPGQSDTQPPQQQQQAGERAGSDNGSTKGWSSLDGMPRPVPTSWQPNPSDGILQSNNPYGQAGAEMQRPASTGPPGGPGGMLHHSLDGGFPRMNSLPQLSSHNAGAAAVAAAGLAAQQRAQSVPPGLPSGLGGLTPAQQQLLQQHLFMQQQQQQKGEPHLPFLAPFPCMFLLACTPLASALV